MSPNQASCWQTLEPGKIGGKREWEKTRERKSYMINYYTAPNIYNTAN